MDNMAKNKRDIVEIFGHAPYDISKDVRSFWKSGACPFINKPCNKYNHNQTIIYGVCSVTSPYGDIIICPNRLYANSYETIRRVAADAFGDKIEFLFYEQYLKKRGQVKNCIVALGQNSGKEVKIAKSLSMDWVLTYICDSELKEYIGIEVQSIDITGNYRDAWAAYEKMKRDASQDEIPSSGHGLNWANVHKRLIPQLIRKGIIYSRSKLVKKGLYFVLPEIVYVKFEEILGKDIPEMADAQGNTLTVHTYELGERADNGSIRELTLVRRCRFSLDELSKRFISGPNLPAGEELDKVITQTLGFQAKQKILI